MPVTLDMFEYANHAAAQEAYPSSDTGYTSDICVGGTASASSVSDDNRYAHLAFDDSLGESNRWASQITSPPHWIKYDLGAGNEKIARQFRVYPQSAYPKDFKFQGSNNNSDWDDLHTGQVAQSQTWQTFSFSNTTAYRYYRMYITTQWGTRVSIFEIEIKGINLQCYSESSIKQQGSYSLEVRAAKTGSLNDTLTRIVSPTVNLSDLRKIKLYVYASRTGTNLQIRIRDSGSTWSDYNVAIGVANAWELKEWDISGVSNANKDVIDRIQIKITNADAANVIYIDNMLGGWPVAQMPILV